MKLISDFAERLRIALDFRNMKATELSELTGINKSTISQYLSKEYEPKRERIELFAKTLNVNEVWLTGYDVSMEINSSDKNDSLIEKYELSPEELKEYENIKMTTSTLMFNGRPASENDKIELEKILKDFFVKALLKKRADEENDRQKKKRNSKID
ncbi:bifunctional HTH-domain containing protein/aminotransferase [Fusobacterium polymorphum]|uniref:Transcriptional regulator n=1 Tax=Fusobacterium polymorphum ATCC 10953 TaxID=393480 RepID=A5TS82_FUSNP|nr:helix-turn-helix domain-containing protein [Fusobacterium polymorphum]EDK87757.1 transcriptional regulator [Fusobacterium polymorphum ATCC 10953]UTI53128.1 helix-turn-helix domain-containing protein [Fusobacterium polymorphum]WRL67644.1 helix-turn-helix domain-containing protein [Fusobacterium polymorphum]CKG60738.1 bifunctional HTH-domain containing protein/aminotransferase [Fusobacterium polymorphum]